MLTSHRLPSQRLNQHGMVLFLAIVVLVAMSLAAVGLMRSVLSSNRVAGNLAFQQSAAQSANVGLETAVAWLEQKARERLAGNVPANKLYNDITAAAGEAYVYRALRDDPDPSETWEAFWSTMRTDKWVNSLPVDGAGNTVSFLINRLCSSSGSPTTAGCEGHPFPRQDPSCGASMGGDDPPPCPVPTYYRITVRVEGPRNAVSFSQAIVSL